VGTGVEHLAIQQRLDARAEQDVGDGEFEPAVEFVRVEESLDHVGVVQAGAGRVAQVDRDERAGRVALAGLGPEQEEQAAQVVLAEFGGKIAAGKLEQRVLGVGQAKQCDVLGGEPVSRV
jgi:hypothetical protein